MLATDAEEVGSQLAGRLVPADVLDTAGGLLAARAGRAALPVFLLHQPLFVLLWLVTLPLAPLPGLHDVPNGGAWLAARAGWLAVVALLLAGAVRAVGGRAVPRRQEA